LHARLLQGGNTLIACLAGHEEKAEILRGMGVAVVELPAVQGRVCLASLLQDLARREINEVLVEAGQVLNGALLEIGLVDELLLYYAPTLLGSTARGMMDLPEFTSMSQRIDLDILSLDRVGQDIRIRARPR